MTIHNEWPALPKIARIADFKERKKKPSLPGRNARSVTLRVSGGKIIDLHLADKPLV